MSSIITFSILSLSAVAQVAQPFLIKEQSTIGPQQQGPILDGYLIYKVSSGSHSLWKTNATSQGTTLVYDFSSIHGTILGSFIRLPSSILFTLDDDAHGWELWRTDGTTQGTQLVKDIFPGPSNSSPENFAVLNGKAYFSARSDTTTGTELWESDGTEQGTVLLANITPSPLQSSYPGCLRSIGDTIWFAAESPSDRELWKTDGTTAGTVFVKDLLTSNPGNDSSNPCYFTSVGDRVVFSARANISDNRVNLWVTDGTSNGTTIVREFVGSQTNGALSPLGLPFDSFAVFRGNDGATGSEPWSTDATTTGTILLTDINPGLASSDISCSSEARFARKLGTRLLFAATNATFGPEPWVSDGTPAGTHILSDLVPGANGSCPSSSLVKDDYVVFLGGGKIWISDGTEQNTLLLASPNFTSFSPRFLQFIGGTLLLAFRESSGSQVEGLWGISVPHCGDGNREYVEECDDGNNADGDGCSATCHAEPAPIPTASTWGLLFLLIGVATAGTCILRRSRLA